LWRIFWDEKFVKELLAEKFVKDKILSLACEGEGLRFVKEKLG
jgi:hypothetical protein